MGGEIAYATTQAGLRTVLKDIEQGFLDAGLEKMRQIYEMKVRRRRMSAEDMEEKLSLVETTLEYGPFKAVDLVIEAVPENLELKQQVFFELEEVCHEGAILTSNTSALSITDIADRCKQPEFTAGMHFFNPVSMMRLVEVIRGGKTSAETEGIVCSVAENIGKTPVVCADSAGFIVNRLLCTAMLEAERCESEGIMDRRNIDRALVKPDAGFPTGLFRMADQLGIDLIYKVMRILEDSFGNRMAVPEVIADLYKSGNLGLKTGKGFYTYPEETVDPEKPDDESRDLVVRRILTSVVAEARRLVAEGVAAEEDIDIAMRHGALLKKPPFSYTREIGKENMDGLLEKFENDYGPRFGKP